MSVSDDPQPVSLVGIFLKARELEKLGKDVIHFEAGEPDYQPPDEVIAETVRAIKEGRGRYTEASGIPSARNAISENLERNLGLKISTDRILITSGGRMALYLSFTTLPKTSIVGIISPDWPAYRDLANFFGFPVRYFAGTLEKDWDLDLEAVRNSGCNVLVLNYPNNPTGKILKQDTFEELVRIAIEKQMTIISDEVYSNFVYTDQERFRSVLETSGLRYVYVTSLSKSYSMTGYRAAYVISDRNTISRLSNINGLILTSTPEFVQYSVMAAMNCDDYVKEKVEMLKKRRDIAVNSLRKKLGAELYPPDGSLYIFPRLRLKGKFDSEKFALELLEKKFVSVTPGTSFGNNYREHFRMTLLQNEKRIEEGIDRMAQLIN